jgi:hypothetical protein
VRRREEDLGMENEGAKMDQHNTRSEGRSKVGKQEETARTPEILPAQAERHYSQKRRKGEPEVGYVVHSGLVRHAWVPYEATLSLDELHKMAQIGKLRSQANEADGKANEANAKANEANAKARKLDRDAVWDHCKVLLAVTGMLSIAIVVGKFVGKM